MSERHFRNTPKCLGGKLKIKMKGSKMTPEHMGMMEGGIAPDQHRTF